VCAADLDVLEVAKRKMQDAAMAAAVHCMWLRSRPPQTADAHDALMLQKVHRADFCKN
jgi:hypothetical protein